MKEAAGHRAELIVLPESFIPAYPNRVGRLAVLDDDPSVGKSTPTALHIRDPAPLP